MPAQQRGTQTELRSIEVLSVAEANALEKTKDPGESRTCGQAIRDFLSLHMVNSDALAAIDDGNEVEAIARHFGVNSQKLRMLARKILGARSVEDLE